jgi:hypothetical protein
MTLVNVTCDLWTVVFTQKAEESEREAVWRCEGDKCGGENWTVTLIGDWGVGGDVDSVVEGIFEGCWGDNEGGLLIRT